MREAETDKERHRVTQGESESVKETETNRERDT
jgi:hypothetical protein